MKPFIGRSFELDELDHFYASGKFEMIIVYGRNGIGKSTLCRKFAKNKKDVLFFAAQKASEQENLEALSQAIWHFDHPESKESGPVYRSMREALGTIFKKSLERQIIFVIDNLPYLLESSPGIDSSLQHLIDQYESTSKLFLLANGARPAIEKEVFSYHAPLYGRKTGQFHLKSFEFAEMREFVPNFSREEQVFCYGIFGGIPNYLQLVDDSISIKENVKSLFLHPDSLLFEEPYHRLKDLSSNFSCDPAACLEILACVSEGINTIPNLADHTHFSVSAVSRLCRMLEDLELLAIVTPVIEEPAIETSKRHTRCSINDPLLRFWLTFIRPNRSDILQNRTEQVWKRIEKQLEKYLHPVFVQICQEYLWEMLKEDRCDVMFMDLGHWQGINPAINFEEEIDIVGADDENAVLFGECSWTDAPVDADAVNPLLSKTILFPLIRKVYYVFSKSGFTKKAIELSVQNPDLHLVAFNTMIDDLDQLIQTDSQKS